MDTRKFSMYMCLLWVLVTLFWGANQVLAVQPLTPGVDYTVAN